MGRPLTRPTLSLNLNANFYGVKTSLEFSPVVIYPWAQIAFSITYTLHVWTLSADCKICPPSFLATLNHTTRISKSHNTSAPKWSEFQKLPHPPWLALGVSLPLTSASPHSLLAPSTPSLITPALGSVSQPSGCEGEDYPALEPTLVPMPRQNYQVGDVSPYTHHMYPICPTPGLVPGQILALVPQAHSETLSNILWLVE